MGGLKAPAACPCESGKPYAACCGRLHSGAAIASTAEALMRSRYSAFVLKLDAYLRASWHVSTRPAELDLSDDNSKWLGLSIKQHQLIDADHACVEFIARYRIAGRGHRLHESSRFVREDGRWFYVDGDLHS